MIENFKTLSEEDKLRALALQARICLRNLERRNKASSRAYKSGSVRKGIRGGKRITIDAKITTACQVYKCVKNRSKWDSVF